MFGVGAPRGLLTAVLEVGAAGPIVQMRKLRPDQVR